MFKTGVWTFFVTIIELLRILNCTWLYLELYRVWNEKDNFDIPKLIKQKIAMLKMDILTFWQWLYSGVAFYKVLNCYRNNPWKFGIDRTILSCIKQLFFQKRDLSRIVRNINMKSYIRDFWRMTDRPTYQIYSPNYTGLKMLSWGWNYES